MEKFQDDKNLRNFYSNVLIFYFYIKAERKEKERR
jgi:hypothetical protein